MKKFAIIIISLMSLVCVSCGPPGTVVYEKVGGSWVVKEVHLQMQNITSESIEQGKDTLNDYAK